MARWVAVLAFIFVLCVVAQCNEHFRPEKNTTDYIPVVLWHGMGDTCCFPWSMGSIKRLIEKQLPGIYVYSVMVGNNIVEDEINGFLGDVNEQIAQITEKFQSDPKLSRGFSAVGFSQGGQFLRGYVEMYNTPKVYNLVTMGGQHQGVFGFPNCPPNNTLCETTRRLLDLGAYLPPIQKHSVQAQYWHDPLQEELYAKNSAFLSVINNEVYQNVTYKQNLLSLENFVMVKFLNDTVVIPNESEWFGFYAPGQDKQVIPVEQTDLYIQDWIGLQELDSTNRLIQLGCEGNHLEFTDQYFIDAIIGPYLNQTFST